MPMMMRYCVTEIFDVALGYVDVEMPRIRTRMTRGIGIQKIVVVRTIMPHPNRAHRRIEGDEGSSSSLSVVVVVVVRTHTCRRWVRVGMYSSTSQCERSTVYHSPSRQYMYLRRKSRL